MSAQLAGHGVPTNSFSAHLALAAGVTVSIHAPSMHALRNVVAVLQPSEPANDAGNAPLATPAGVTVPVGSSATPTAASSVQAAAAVAAGEAGNASAAVPQGGSSAQPASTSTPSASAETAGGEPVSFDALKKAFLALSTKPGGRTLCEGVLKPFSLGKLSEAKPEQYAAVLANIQKAGA